MRGKRNLRRSAPASDKSEEIKVAVAEPVRPRRSGLTRMLKRFISSPNFAYQGMVILLTLTQGNVQMDRRIDTMTSSVDTLRNITGVIDTAMQSLKTAAEAPKQIRRLIGPKDG